ncbi:MAG: hypothetical protein N2653_14160 [Burkholderiales bacterium]|nr:hypothetical protein [Burkholderiales bacterium]
MGASDILALLAAQGLTVRPLPGGALEVSPKERLTDEIRDFIRRHRAQILAALTARQPAPDRHDREAKRRELRRLIETLARLDPEHWTPADVAEALEAGEQDIASALATWRTIAKQAGLLPEPEPLSPRAADRRRRVLQMLRERPEIKRALIADDADPQHPDAVIVAIGIRRPDGTICTGELAIRRERYDGIALLALLERHGGATVH